MPIVITNNTSIKLHGATTSDDDMSTGSSPLPVENSPHQLKKKVCFSTEPCRYYDNQTMCQEDNRVYCWYQPHTLHRFRRETVQTVQLVSPVRSPIYHCVLERTFEACSKEAEVSSGETAMDKSTSALTVPENESLPHCVQIVSDRIGLEKWANAKVANEKKTRRQQLNQLILREKETRANPQEESDPQQAECLREECERITKPNRLFARCLAGALATAVRNHRDADTEDDDDDDDDSSC